MLQQLERRASPGRERQRRVPAAVAVLRPHRAARAAPRPRCPGACGCSPTPPRRARSRSRYRRTSRPRRSTSPPSCSRSAPGTSAGHVPSRGPGARPSLIRGAPAAADRRRRRVRYSQADRGAPRVRRGHGHPGGGDPGRQGLARRRPPAGPRRRSARPGPSAANACAARRRRRHRHRHPVQRLHDRIAHRVPDPDVRFVNINVAAFDAYKHGRAARHRRRARGARRARRSPEGWSRPSTPSRAGDQGMGCRRRAAFAPVRAGVPRPDGDHRRGARGSRPADVVVQAAGSLPGDLHKLWRVRDPLGYHVEYAYSCMGYEIAGGLGVKRALAALGSRRHRHGRRRLVPDAQPRARDGGRGGHQDHRRPRPEPRLRLHRRLSETVGSERFGTRLPRAQHRDRTPGRRSSSARRPGRRTPRSRSDERPARQERGRAGEGPGGGQGPRGRPVVIHVETVPAGHPRATPGGDVPVAATSTLESTRAARSATSRPRPPSALRNEERAAMRTVSDWIEGKATTGEAAAPPRCGNPAMGAQQAEVVDAEAGRRRRRGAGCPARLPGLGDSSVSRRTKILFAFRELVNARTRRDCRGHLRRARQGRRRCAR